MIFAGHHIDFAFHGVALINAVALAKVMPVARKHDLSTRMKEAPLFYSTLLKPAFFPVVLASFKILEDAAIGLHRHRFSAEYISEWGGGTWVFAVLIPFVGFGELRRVIGQGKLEKLFVQRHPLESAPS